MEGTALILAGGGGKGAYEIGVWGAMRELGIDKEITAGGPCRELPWEVLTGHCLFRGTMTEPDRSG